MTTKSVFVYAAAGTQPPAPNIHGLLTLPEVVVDTVELAPKMSFDLLLSGLLPGTYYHELIRLSDEFGNWEYVVRNFTTLRRHVTVKLAGIDIQDDSDDLSNGEASFEFELQTGNRDDPQSWTTRDKTTYANNNIESGKAVAPVPTGVTEIPPEPVNPRHRHVRFRVSAVEDDSDGFSIGENDTAWGMKDLHLPDGLNEKVKDRAETVGAGPGDNDFQFSVSVLYSVDYI